MFSTLAIVFSPPGANANDIGFDIAQISTAEGFQIVVTPNESVCPGDQLIIADEGSGDESTLYALQLKDADSDGVADSVRFTIPQGSAHRLVISVVPVDGSTGSAYCGIGAKQQLNVQGGSRKELVFSGSPDMLTKDTVFYHLCTIAPSSLHFPIPGAAPSASCHSSRVLGVSSESCSSEEKDSNGTA